MSETTSRSDDPLTIQLPSSLQPSYRTSLPPILDPNYRAPLSEDLRWVTGSPLSPPGTRPGAFPPTTAQPLPAQPQPGQQPPEPEQVAVAPVPLRPAQVPAPGTDPNQPAPTPFPGLDQSLIIDPTGRYNPGNLRTGSGRGGPTDFQRFPNMQAGIQALQRNLLRYQDQLGLNTIEGIINTWTPPRENNTELAIKQAEGVMGIDRKRRIDLHDPATMAAMTNAILFNEQQGNRGRPMRTGLNQAVPNIGDVRSQMRLPQPQQNYIPAEPRSFGEWGKQPVGMYSTQSEDMPQQSDFGRIMGSVAPLLLAIGSLALRLPLSTAITAYGAMARAQQNGQDEAAKRHRTYWRDKHAEANAQQAEESREAGDAFAEYGTNNPQGLQQRLAQIALKYNDHTMYTMAERGQLNEIYKLQQRRDALNSDLTKVHAAADAEQKRQDAAAAVAAMDKEWLEKNPGATQAQLDIVHAQHVGDVHRMMGGTAAGGQAAEGQQLYNVVGADGKPTGTYLRLGRDGGYHDANTGERYTMKPGERPEPVSKPTAAKPPPEVPPGWVKPGTKLPPAEDQPPQQDQEQDQESQPQQPTQGGDQGGAGGDQGDQGGDGGGDQGSATQAPPAPEQTAAADEEQAPQRPYQEAALTPTPPPTGAPAATPTPAAAPQAYPGPKYKPGPAMQQLEVNGEQTARDMLRGNPNAVKSAPKQVQPAIEGGYRELQKQVDDVADRASLPEGDPRRLKPNEIMPALRDIDKGFADDLNSLLRYDRAVPSAGGFGSGSAPFWNSLVNLASKVNKNWMPHNYQRVRDFSSQQGKTFQTIQLTQTLASTGASVIRDVARIGKDFDSNAFVNAWNSWQAGKLEGDPRYTTLAADWQSFIIEANRLRTVTGSVVESEQQIGVLVPGRNTGLLSSGIIPSNDRQFRDMVKNELANSYPKVEGFIEEWNDLKPGVRMPGQAYIDKAVPTINAIMHMNAVTGNYYGVPVPQELHGSGMTVRDPDLDALLKHALEHPEDPQSLIDIRQLREEGVY